MIFNGDLSKYHPADAIMFLSQLNMNGDSFHHRASSV